MRVFALLSMAIGACLTALSSPAEPIVTIPLVDRVPVIDGTLDVQEWSGAAALPPLMAGTNNVSGFDTRIFLAWSPETLFIAVQHQRRPQAPMANDPRSKDQLTITLSGPAEPKLQLVVWAGAARLEPDNQKVAPVWRHAGSSKLHGWTTEIAVPLPQLGSRESLLQSGAHLEIELREPSLGVGPKRLVQSLRFAERRLAFRFLGAGEFADEAQQGCMVELINADEQSANLSLKVAVVPENGETKRFETENLLLPGDARRRVRLAFPARTGLFHAEYQLAVDGSPHSAGNFRFFGSGPVRVELIPFFLWRGGVFIRSTPVRDAGGPGTNDPPLSLDCQLSDPRENHAIKWREIVPANGQGATEQFVDTTKLRPGPYCITLTVRRGNELWAVKQVPFIRPEYPKWWKPRR